MKILVHLLPVLLAAPALAGEVVSEENSWIDHYPVSTSSPRLEIENVWGSVRVRPGGPDKISVAISERRTAPDQARFDRSKDSIYLDIEADAAGVSIYIGNRNERYRNFNDCQGCRVDYQFDVTVPPGTIVDVGTVLDGKVDVAELAGPVSASNVNGPIRIAGVHDCGIVNSINGVIEMKFSRAPGKDCSIETINGDVMLDLPLDASLDVALDLFNGQVKSDFPVGPLEFPATVERVTDDGRTQYRLQQLAGVRIGAGGPTYSIASMNGDVLIRKH